MEYQLDQGVRPSPRRGQRLLPISIFFAALVVTLSLPAVGQASFDSPKHFKLREFLQYEKDIARWACGSSDGERCVTYSAMCRKFTKGRIECYSSQVIEDEDHLGSTEGVVIREEFDFTLYYPQWRRKTENGRPYWPRSLKIGYVELDALRCARRAKPYLCNGPWAWKNGAKLRWSCGATERICYTRPLSRP